MKETLGILVLAVEEIVDMREHGRLRIDVVAGGNVDGAMFRLNGSPYFFGRFIFLKIAICVTVSRCRYYDPERVSRSRLAPQTPRGAKKLGDS